MLELALADQAVVAGGPPDRVRGRRQDGDLVVEIGSPGLPLCLLVGGLLPQVLGLSHKTLHCLRGLGEIGVDLEVALDGLRHPRRRLLRHREHSLQIDRHAARSGLQLRRPSVLFASVRRAGNSKDYYVVAPGYSSFSSYIGTSFAAPYVSGTAAAILSQNPRLNAQQVSEIILNSADDMGAPGTDEVYGRGKLNTAAALAPQGDLDIPGSSDDGGSSSGALAAGLVIGAGVAAAVIVRNKKLKEAVVVDSYDRPYQLDLGELIEVRSDGLSLDRMMMNLRRTTEMAQLDVTEQLRMAVWYDRDPAQSLYPVSVFDDQENIENWSLSLHQGGSRGAYYALNLNLDPRQFFGLAEEINETTLFDRRNLTAPYAGFASSANMALAGYKTAQGVDLKLGVVDMDDSAEYGLESKSVLLEGSIQPHEKLRLGVQFSGLNEQGSLFGGASAGALSVEKSETLAAGFTARMKLSQKLSLHSIYSQGYTLVKDRNSILLGPLHKDDSSSVRIEIGENQETIDLGDLADFVLVVARRVFHVKCCNLKHFTSSFSIRSRNDGCM